MTPHDLLETLTAGGFALSVDSGRLLVTPASLLTDELRAAIREGKTALLALLAARIEDRQEADAGAPAATGGGRPPELRLYRLSPDQEARAHARPWDDAACARFEARARLFRRRGFSEVDAEDLAELATLGEVDGDGLRSCIDCSGLASSGRCARFASIGADRRHEPDVTRLIRCPCFTPRPGAAA